MTTPIDRLKYELGDALVRFANLEAIVSFLSVGLMRESPDVCMGILGELSFRKKVGVLSALVRARAVDPDTEELANKALKVIYRSEEGRNRLVHSTWSVSSQSDEIFRMKPTARGKAGFDSGFRQIKEGEVQDTLAVIAEATELLVACASMLEQKEYLRFRITENKN